MGILYPEHSYDRQNPLNGYLNQLPTERAERRPHRSRPKSHESGSARTPTTTPNNNSSATISDRHAATEHARAPRTRSRPNMDATRSSPLDRDDDRRRERHRQHTSRSPRKHRRRPSSGSVQEVKAVVVDKTPGQGQGVQYDYPPAPGAIYSKDEVFPPATDSSPSSPELDQPAQLDSSSLSGSTPKGTHRKERRDRPRRHQHPQVAAAAAAAAAPAGVYHKAIEIPSRYEYKTPTDSEVFSHPPPQQTPPPPSNPADAKRRDRRHTTARDGRASPSESELYWRTPDTPSQAYLKGPRVEESYFEEREPYGRRRSRRGRYGSGDGGGGGAEYADESSIWDEVEYYKYGRAPEEEGEGRSYRGCWCGWCGGWSRRKKWIVFGSSAGMVVAVIVIVAVAAALLEKKHSSSSGYDYSPSNARVTNSKAFGPGGGATHADPANVQDGIGAGADEYTYYSGDAAKFPDASKWVSFGAMWNANVNTIKNACGWLNEGENNTPQQIQDIYDAIQDRANASSVDHRFILATVLQESSGCVHVGQTTSSGGVKNPGLMQSHDGHVFDPSHARTSIEAMVQDGTQGTSTGDGLVQNLNTYGNLYEAARGYNSGYVPKTGNLSEAAGATACYVSDIANRLTGWTTAKSTCPGDTAS